MNQCLLYIPNILVFSHIYAHSRARENKLSSHKQTLSNWTIDALFYWQYKRFILFNTEEIHQHWFKAIRTTAWYFYICMHRVSCAISCSWLLWFCIINATTNEYRLTLNFNGGTVRTCYFFSFLLQNKIVFKT